MIDSHGNEKADSYDHYIPKPEEKDTLLPTDEEPVGEGEDTVDYDDSGEPVSGTEEYAD